MGRSRESRKRGRERGTALIEFALVFPFLLVLTLTVIDMSRAFYVKNVLHQSAREGARRLVVLTFADSSQVRQRVLEVANAAKSSVTGLTYQDLGNSQWQVTVTGRFNWLYPGLFNWLGATYTNPVTLTAKSVMRKEG